MRFWPGTNQRGKEERGQAALPNLETFDLEESAGGVCVKDRLIPMNATVRTLLGNQAKTSTYVFPSPRTKERLVEIKSSFVRAVKAAKIPDLRFHDLRHTAATRMVTPARTRSRWLRSSAGQTFGWRCVTPTRWRTQSAAQSKQSRKVRFHVT